MGLILEFGQLLSGMLQIDVQWGPPLSNLAGALQVLLLKDLDLLPTACLVGHGPVDLYVVETLWPLLLLLLFVIVFTVDRRVRPKGRHSFAALINTVGLIL